MRLLTFFRTLPEQFEENNYDWSKFRLIFTLGFVAIWLIVIAVYFFFSESHSFRATGVAIVSAFIFTLIWFPLAVAQTNKNKSSKDTDHNG